MGFRNGERKRVHQMCLAIVKRHLDRDMGYAFQVFGDSKTRKVHLDLLRSALIGREDAFRDHDSVIATGGLWMLPLRRLKWIPERSTMLRHRCD